MGTATTPTGTPPEAVTRRRAATIATSNLGAVSPWRCPATWFATVIRSANPNASEAKHPLKARTPIRYGT
ncbi:hypothetical protein FB465_0855 [Kitasatospora atroaurantiaca]|uniref:Uncharacterized protein n=1 Tax=Kitasatospora atroaurantiaca TaxID=285545 RepID=A0A561EJW9_9ACTN|nr:hypothetical protein FB465_0855 [Kitasatospora atroaurantiaca]